MPATAGKASLPLRAARVNARSGNREGGLLPQAGGFEGLRLVHVHGAAHNLAVAESGHPRIRRDCDFDSAASSLYSMARRPGDNLVACIDQFRVLVVLCPPRFQPLTPERGDLLQSVVNAVKPRDWGSRRIHLDVGIKRLGCGGPIAVPEGDQHPPHDLNVLLRHRSLREPGGFEGFLAGRVLIDVDDLAVAKLPMRPSAGVNPYPAPSSSTGDAHDRNDVLTVLSQLFDLPAVALPIPRFKPALASAEGSFVTKDEAVPLLQGIPPDGRIERAEPGLRVVLKALQVCADDLHVLPRHPRAVSRAAQSIDYGQRQARQWRLEMACARPCRKPVKGRVVSYSRSPAASRASSRLAKP